MDAETAYRAAHPEKLRMYDVIIDEYRDVTQEDVDAMSRATQAYGRLRNACQETHLWLHNSTGDRDGR